MSGCEERGKEVRQDQEPAGKPRTAGATSADFPGQESYQAMAHNTTLGNIEAARGTLKPCICSFQQGKRAGVKTPIKLEFTEHPLLHTYIHERPSPIRPKQCMMK